MQNHTFILLPSRLIKEVVCSIVLGRRGHGRSGCGVSVPNSTTQISFLSNPNSTACVSIVVEVAAQLRVGRGIAVAYFDHHHATHARKNPPL